MQIIAAYVGDTRHVLEDSGQILSRANQALATLERYKLRLDEVASTLSALEIEDLVTVRDVAVVAQRLEMVTRIAREIEDYVVELGTDGRLLCLAAGGVGHRRRHRTGAGDPRLFCRLDARSSPPRRLTAAHWRRSRPPNWSIPPRWPRHSGCPSPSISTARWLRADTDCWPRCRGCLPRSSTGWSSTSGHCSKLLSAGHRRPTGGRGCRRVAGAVRTRRSVATGGVEHHRRPVRLRSPAVQLAVSLVKDKLANLHRFVDGNLGHGIDHVVVVLDGPHDAETYAFLDATRRPPGSWPTRPGGARTSSTR
jgi:hypothetical protein